VGAVTAATTETAAVGTVAVGAGAATAGGGAGGGGVLAALDCANPVGIWVCSGIAVVGGVAIIGGGIYWYVTSKRATPPAVTNPPAVATPEPDPKLKPSADYRRNGEVSTQVLPVTRSGV
jgi:hypothetical protein